MRLAAIITLALVLSAGVASGAALAPSGSFEVKGGRGTVQITGKGVLVGRLGKGSLEIVDLNPNDQWSPRVNGIPRGKTVTLRGKNVSFYIPGGRYRIIARGSDISISARGTGAVIAERRSRRGRRHRHVRSRRRRPGSVARSADKGDVRAE